MVLSGHEIRAQLGQNIIIDPFDEARLNPNSYNLTLHNELMVYEEVVLDMRRANRVRRIPHSARGPGAAPEPALPGPHHRADRDPQPGADDRGPLLDRAAGAVRPRDRRLRRRGLLRLLDPGDVRRAAGANLCRRGHLPDLLSRHPRLVHRVRQRQVPAQHRHPAQPAVQGADPQRVATTRSGNSPSASSAPADKPPTTVPLLACPAVRRVGARTLLDKPAVAPSAKSQYAP